MKASASLISQSAGCFLPAPGQRKLKDLLESKAPLPPFWGKGPGDEGRAPVASKHNSKSQALEL